MHTAAFHQAEHPDSTPPEATLVDQLRSCPDAIPSLSVVALDADRVVGHVICSRGWIDEHPALGLGPIGVLPDHQGRGVGAALMYAVLGAADALDEPIVVLLGHLDYYPRFRFVPASDHGIAAPVADWQSHFQALPLTGHDPTLRGTFRYAAPFDNV